MLSTLQENKRPRLSDTKWVNKVCDETWVAEILPCSDLKGLSKLSRTSTFFNNFWQRVKRACHDQIDVKQNAKHHIFFRDSKIYLCCPTIERAMALAQQISKIKSWNTALVVAETKPVKIQLDRGVHEIVGARRATAKHARRGRECVQYNNRRRRVVDYGRMSVTCSHITFVGKGKDHTTIRGGFKVENQQNVTFEELTITKSGAGLLLKGSETNVDVLKCVVKECRGAGMVVGGGATVTATQCEFMENSGSGVCCHGENTKARLNNCMMHHNGGDGLYAYSDAVVDLHGTKTDIHSNKRSGICASVRAKVNIRLPSQHNTSHDNVGADRNQESAFGLSGGSIANINAT